MRKRPITRDEVRVQHYEVWTLPGGSFHREKQAGSRLRGCGSRCSISCASKSVSGGRAARRPSPSYGASSSRMSASSTPDSKPPAAIAAVGSTTIIATRVSGARTCAHGRHGLPALRQWSRQDRKRVPKSALVADARHAASQSRRSAPPSNTAPLVAG